MTEPTPEQANAGERDFPADFAVSRARLRELAAEAPGGRWTWGCDGEDGIGRRYVCYGADGRILFARECENSSSGRNALFEFVCRVSPDTITALLDRLDAAEAREAAHLEYYGKRAEFDKGQLEETSDENERLVRDADTLRELYNRYHSAFRRLRKAIDPYAPGAWPGEEIDAEVERLGRVARIWMGYAELFHFWQKEAVEAKDGNQELRAENERLAALNQDKFRHLQAYCHAATEDKAEIARLAARVRELEGERGNRTVAPCQKCGSELGMEHAGFPGWFSCPTCRTWRLPVADADESLSLPPETDGLEEK